MKEHIQDDQNFKADVKKTIIIIIVFTLACLTCGFLYFSAIEKKSVKENSVVVFGIPSIDAHLKEQTITTRQWWQKKTETKIVHDDGLQQAMEEYNKTAQDPKDAYIQKTEEGFVIVPEEGEDLNIKMSLDSLKPVLKTPKVCSSDLAELCKRANAYATWSLTYDNGQRIASSPDQIEIIDGELRISESFIDEQIKEVFYNPEGSGADFTTTKGEDIHVDGGTYGSVIDYEKEAEEVKKLFFKNETVENRRPIFKKERPAKIENDYIEISITDQHMWLYRDGALIAETDVVTGDSSKGRDTPTGAYYIMEKLREKWMNGGEQLTLAHQWMRLTLSGVGIHDAWWRWAFGGDIYTYNGSHGCINTPSQIMETFYENSEEGMPVVIY